MRVVLDVNVVVSSVIGPLGFSRRLWLAWQQERFTLITSDPILTQIGIKLRADRIARRYGLTTGDARQVEALMRTLGTVVPVPPQEVVTVTGDPEDDAVLATVRLGQADYLVTGDAGLLALGSYEGAPIVTPRTMVELLGEAGN